MNCAIIACLKQEELYIREWLDWHIKIGVDHFYLCDNNDKDYEPKLKDVIKDYVDQGIVEVFDYSGVHPIQPICYTDIYDKYGDLYDWWMIIDIDEFLTIPITNNNLKKFLSLPYIKDKYNIALMWRNYGDNDLLEYDGRGCLERFTKPATSFKDKQYRIINGVSNTTKSLFKGKIHVYNNFGIIPRIYYQHNVFDNKRNNPKDPINFIPRHDVYGFSVIKKTKVFNSNTMIYKGELSGFWKYYSNRIYNGCYLKHFVTKTLQEYMWKIDRGDTLVAKGNSKYPYDLGKFFGISQETDEKDKYLYKHYGIKRGKYKNK